MSRTIASRYQPVLVVPHWLTALMIIGLLCVGFFVLADMPNSDPRKLYILKLHMTGGIFVLVLMILRVIVRIWSVHPAKATMESLLLTRLTSIVHYSFYVLVFLMVASGFFTGWLISSAFLPNGVLPNTFTEFPSFVVHAILATLLSSLITGHIAAALYHQFILKDGLFRRMWFGKRTFTTLEK